MYCRLDDEEEPGERETTIQISEVNLKVEEITRASSALIVFDALLRGEIYIDVQLTKVIFNLVIYWLLIRRAAVIQ